MEISEISEISFSGNLHTAGTLLKPYANSVLGKPGTHLTIRFLRVFEPAAVVRHTFPFIVRQVTMGPGVPRNENSGRVPKYQKTYFKSLKIEI
jgi:hypothetical protein